MIRPGCPLLRWNAKAEGGELRSFSFPGIIHVSIISCVLMSEIRIESKQAIS